MDWRATSGEGFLDAKQILFPHPLVDKGSDKLPQFSFEDCNGFPQSLMEDKKRMLALVFLILAPLGFEQYLILLLETKLISRLNKSTAVSSSS